jgi:thioesterase domain-containing protein
MTPNGKIDRKALPSFDGKSVKSGTGYLAPRDALELQLTHIWEEILGVAPIGIRDNFFDLGGHSMLAARLMNRIHNSLGVALPLAMLFHRATIEHLAVPVRQQTGLASEFTSLVEIQSNPSSLPFFCIHPAGGNVFCYVDLARELGPDQAFYAFQSRGLNSGQNPHLQVEDMAAHYIELLREVQPQGPYLLGGWSIGGLIAFEMSQQLQAGGEYVALLALLDTVAPTRYHDAGASDHLALLAAFAQDVGLSLDQLAPSEHNLTRLNTDQQLSQILEQAQIAEVLPPDFNLSQIRRFFEVFVTNVNAARRYVMQARSGRATLFRASERPSSSLQDDANGWDEVLSNELEIHLVPGSHFNMIHPPNVKLLAGRLKACIEKAIESAHVF